MSLNNDLRDHKDLHKLFSSCELGKAKRSTFKTKTVTSSKGRLHLLHMDLCGPMRVESINGKKYILATDFDNSEPVPRLQNVSPPADTADPSLQDLELLFSPMYEEYFTTGNQSVSKYSALSDNHQQQDTQPTFNVQPASEPIIPLTNVTAKENNTDQAENEAFEAYEFINPFAPPGP
ncbi:hypothetical protein Tco_0671671 [Tanacetum coccineum]